MRKIIRFFLFGPGAVLLVVAIGIGVAHVIKEGQDKQRAEAEKHQVQRPLGQVKPSDTVDKGMAPKEVVLSNRRLNAPTNFDQPLPQTQTVSLPSGPGRQPLPQLVSFYAQVPTSTPSPAPTPESIRKTPRAWLPPGVFIPCALVNTVESSHINTPASLTAISPSPSY